MGRRARNRRASGAGGGRGKDPLASGARGGDATTSYELDSHTSRETTRVINDVLDADRVDLQRLRQIAVVRGLVNEHVSARKSACEREDANDRRNAQHRCHGLTD